MTKHIGADMNFAWPTAEIAVMGSKGAPEIIFKKEINEAVDPAKLLEKKLNIDLASHTAAQRLDEVILPQNTRRKLIKALACSKKCINQ
jgi:propionyl-CoA carboxylase beta chain